MQETIRNIGIIAHIDAGKTTTTERMLFISGKTHKIGEVDSGTAQMDWMDQEQDRGITISSACTTIKWKENSINIIDTPGHVDFTVEVERSLRVLDAAIGIFCAVSGVEPQSETVWHQAEHYHVSRIAYINKLDRLGADFYAVLDDIKAKLNIEPLPLTIPIGHEKDFEGIIDLLSMKELHWDKSSSGIHYEKREIREGYRKKAEKWHANLIEKTIEESDELTEKFLNEEEISKQELLSALKKGVRNHSLLPVFCGASLQNIGIQPLLDAVLHFFPSPQEVPPPVLFSLHNREKKKNLSEYKNAELGFVFKSVYDKNIGIMHYVRLYKGQLKRGSSVVNINTQKKERVLRILKMHANRFTQCEELNEGDIAVLVGPKSCKTGHSISNSSHDPYMLEGIEKIEPVISTTLETQTLSDREKLLEVLQRLELEDPSFHYKEDENTGQLLISGMGELHLEVLTTKIKNDYKLEVRQGHPVVNYKESVTEAHAEKYELSEIPGHAETKIYIGITLRIEPSEQEKNKIDSSELDTNVPLEWVQEARQSIEDSMKSGISMGYPVVNTRVHIQALEYEGNEKLANFAIRYASAQAFYNAARKAQVVCMEPMMRLTITTPTDFVGDAMQTLHTRSGLIHNIENKRQLSVIDAEVRLSELFGFSTVLRNATEGRGRFSMEFLRYLPRNAPRNTPRNTIV